MLLRYELTSSVSFTRIVYRSILYLDIITDFAGKTNGMFVLKQTQDLPSNTVDIILRPYEKVLLGNSRTGAALLFELILGKDLKFASRLDNRGFAFLGEEIYPAIRPDW